MTTNSLTATLSGTWNWSDLKSPCGPGTGPNRAVGWAVQWGDRSTGNSLLSKGSNPKKYFHVGTATDNTVYHSTANSGLGDCGTAAAGSPAAGTWGPIQHTYAHDGTYTACVVIYDVHYSKQSLTTLSAAINSTQTSFGVVSATKITSGEVLVIDSEQMLVTGKSGNTVTVTRHVNGTSAAPHAKGAAVSGIVLGNPNDIVAGSNSATYSTGDHNSDNSAEQNDPKSGKAQCLSTTFTVTFKRPTGTVSTPSTQTLTFGDSVTDSAVVTGTNGGPAPTGTVTFYVCGPSATVLISCASTSHQVGTGAVTLTADPGDPSKANAASASFKPSAPGSYCFYAVYGGDGTYQGSNDGSSGECFTVNKAPTGSVSTPSSTTRTFGQSLTDSAVVIGNTGGPAPTGTVTFYVCGPSATTLTSCASTSQQVGTPVTLTADANPAKGDATSAGFTPSAPGSYCFYAVYGGDSNYTGSNDGGAGECFTVNKAPTGSVSTPSSTTLTFGQSLTDSAVVTGNTGGPAPTGTVSFYVCGPSATTLTSCASTGQQVGTGAVSLTANANPAKADATSASFTPSAPGSYCFYAVYSGDGKYVGSNDGSAGECFTVNKAPTGTVSTPSNATLTFGGSLTDSAVVTGNTGGPAPTGTVTFYVCGPSSGLTSCAAGTGQQVGTAVTLTADANPAQADATSASFTPSAPGDYCFYAAYSGDSNYQTSDDGSAGECFTVNKAPTGTVSTPSSTTLTFGRSLTDSAVVTGNTGGPSPTGTVTFYVCGPSATTLTSCDAGTGQQVGIGVSLTADANPAKADATSASFAPSAPGSYCFDAVYSGDSNYQTSDDGSAGECFTVVPNQAPTDVQLSNNSIAENQPAATDIGTLTTTDPDAGDTHTYTLANTGCGGGPFADDSSFQIGGVNGDKLQSAASFDFETKSSYTVCVRTTDNGGLSFDKQLTIAITNVNEAATDITLTSNSIAENSGANAVIGTLGATDPDTGETYSFTLENAGCGGGPFADNGSFNISSSSLRENASFDFETKSSYSICVRVTDGPNTFDKTFTINVTNVNEAPTDITLTSNSIAENSGANAVIGTLGTADPDTGETYSFTLENAGCSGGPFADNGSFNISGSSLRENASFDFETKNSYSICVRVTDGPNTFDKTFTINVTNVNEAPTDISLDNSNIDENKPSGSLVGNLSQLGDPDSGETYTFTLLTSGCLASFPDSGSFQISGGQLQSAVSFNYEVRNSYSICVRVNDPGSPNLSFEKQFTISINDVNDNPVDGDESVNAVGNTLLEYGSVASPSSAAKKVLSGNLLANATDEDQPPQTLSISASDTTSAQGGDVSVSSSGAFSYVPKAGFTGTDTFNYTVSDGNGGTDTSTVTITVASRVWYVKNNATAGGTGRSTDPFNTLAAADTAANATGDITYVYKGDGTTTGLTGGFSLLASQKLLGEPVNLVVGTDTLALGTPANRPSLSGTVALASGSRVEAVDIAGSAGAAIAGTNTGGSDVTNVNLTGGAGGVALTGAAAGTFNFTNFTINTSAGTGFLVNSSGAPTINVGSGFTENVSATGGPAVDVRNANTASNLTFDAVSSTNSSGTGINLDSNGATPFSASSGSISGAAGNAIAVNGGSGNVTYPGTLGDGAGGTAAITGRTGGAISLSGNINDGSDAGGGITMSGNTGGSTTFSGTTKTLNTGASAAFSSTGSGQTITFSGGGLNIDTTSGAGFSATGGGTVNVTGTVNTIDSTTGTALNVSSTNIGASGLTFEHISSNGASSGIVLNSTGSSGGLTVTGTGSTANGGDASGGLIQNSTARGIQLTNTDKVSLNDVKVNTTVDAGIGGSGVTDFTLTNSTVSNNGSSHTSIDSNIEFGTATGGAPTDDNVDGVVTITNNLLTNAWEHGIDIQNYSGTISNATISNNTLTSATSAASSLGSGIRLLGFGSAGGTSNITKATISNNTINYFPGGAGITAQFGNSAGTGGTWGTPNNATNLITISGNTITGFSAAAPVNTNAVLATLAGNGQAHWKIDNNTASLVGGTYIGVNVAGVAPVAQADITNNHLTGMVSANAQTIAFDVDFLTASTDHPTLSGTISGNTISGQDGEGIQALVPSSTSGSMSVSILNNSITAPNCSGCNRFGMTFNAGLSTTVTGAPTLCAKVSGNTSAGSGVDTGIGFRKRTGATLSIDSFPAPGTDPTAYLTGLNPLGGGVTNITGSTAGSCTAP